MHWGFPFGPRTPPGRSDSQACRRRVGRRPGARRPSRLRTNLYVVFDARAVLDRWTALLTEQASDLISGDTLQNESDTIAAFLTGDN